MSKTLAQSPPDRREREQALDSVRSILVQAPAGSGKTDLLTRRFLRLLGEVDSPDEVVAITFTIAAVAEMRHRILTELEKAAGGSSTESANHDADDFSMRSLARRALEHSRALGWDLLNVPGQLRISTIDSFCRELALQQPLLSGLGGGIAIAEQPSDLYRRAARRTLEDIDGSDASLSAAVEALLLWRDNNWQDLESQLVEMLKQRDRWMQGFVLEREPDWDALRARLEHPFANAVRNGLKAVGDLLDQVDGARDEALALARFACSQCNGLLHRDLAELAEFPQGPFADAESLEESRLAHTCLAQLLLTKSGTLRQRVDKSQGFPADRKHEKGRILTLIAALGSVPGLEAALANACQLPPGCYTENEWQIVRACFTLLRRAAGELQVVFAEEGVADFTEVAQIALRVLQADGEPSDAALAVADGIRHLLIDEFQDTSRRQHELLRRLVAAWPEREGRTCFVVGDPMQSIYFFRDADAELFPRVRALGLEVPGSDPLHLDFVPLAANFRTAPALVDHLNGAFDRIFAAPDGSGIAFSPAIAAREDVTGSGRDFELHLEFVPQASRAANAGATDEIEAGHAVQTSQIVELVRERLPLMEESRSRNEKYRIAVLGRTRSALAPIAQALRESAIPFRALDLEPLAERPEVLDALALARALLNPEDRVAWLGVLRAPWCGLALDDLHKLAGNDDAELLERPVPELLAERLPLLSVEGASAAGRILDAMISAPQLRGALPNASLGTWLEQVWLRLGGADCVDATARANLDLLWSCLDSLPRGEQDLLGSALDAALEKLTALPDPNTGSECGVQLMTIHKSKGLEFEIVIVPDLQSRCRTGDNDLLSWLERGVAAEDELTLAENSGEITEFLVAPLPSKGADRGQAKKWVDRVRREREAQEDRRILYVAATRAREELHLFARPAYKTESNGSLSLCEPASSLLATAWPALEEEARLRFEEWRAAMEKRGPASSQIESIAAAAEESLPVIPFASKSTRLRRLPAHYSSAPSELVVADQSVSKDAASATRLYQRHEGGLRSRALGRAVHALLLELARLRATQEWEPARAALQRVEPRIAADLRATGLDPMQAAQVAAEALEYALSTSRDPVGQWILSPHGQSASEVRWVGVLKGSLHSVQADRVFRAGPAPRLEGDDCWWIIDYKTAHDELDSRDALPELRTIFAPQLEVYAAVLRNLYAEDRLVRAGLYYPRMLTLDWWEM
jgi:ATP-dependent helicase/nuclease subunit A